MKRLTRRTILFAAPSALAIAALPVRAAKRYGPGVSDTEIKIGNTCFYSGPASSYGTIGKAMAAYYKMVNDQGGVNGRKISFISYDDALIRRRRPSSRRAASSNRTKSYSMPARSARRPTARSGNT